MTGGSKNSGAISAASSRNRRWNLNASRAQALGGANSVGDQLPPRGILDPDAYELIGAVYAQCEEA
jgi:hypothetical protein